MWELDYKESWARKNWRFWTTVLENSWESAGRPNQSILKEINPDFLSVGKTIRVNKLSNIAGYKINTENSVAFLYISNNSPKGNEQTSLFKKYPEIHLTKKF